MTMARAFISVGSNINPEKNMKEALRLLALQIQVVKISTVYHTVPEYGPEQERHREQPWYYHCVVEIHTDLRPEELRYALLRRIEKRLGRVRTANKYAARAIDLDLILYGDPSLRVQGLPLPDPEIIRRPFIASALRELFPDLRLSGGNRSLQEAASNLSPENAKILGDYTNSLRQEFSHGGQY